MWEARACRSLAVQPGSGRSLRPLAPAYAWEQGKAWLSLPDREWLESDDFLRSLGAELGEVITRAKVYKRMDRSKRANEPCRLEPY